MAISMPYLAKLLSSQYQELILFPTEQCNFRCIYCYEDFEVGRMSKKTVDGIKALLKQRIPELRELHLSWFGGEPLVAKDIVLDISSYASELSKQYSNISYYGSITTNAYLLTPKVFSNLVSVGVKNFQITLDGPDVIHNQRRLRANGEGTFDRIWTHLTYMQESSLQFKVTLRVHFDLNSINHLLTFIDVLRNKFANDARFNILFKPLEHLGGPNDHLVEVVPFADREKIITSFNQRLYGKTQSNKNENAENPYVCYAAKPNSLTIRANGSIGKCTVALNDPRNQIGVLQSDGTLTLDKDRLNPWFNGFSNLDENILSCPLKGFN
ncbi:radical SAM protein [Lysinibacillus fusiformis]|uniref:radical SAM protein n=1 Tax=Lysinibacillus fusiformis TaxID=28031 RepID=UPI00187E0746|nr:radical SAM protein [Lysinibacillus fusiformis]MBD8523813.1 radical SAM protein [Lysinibacillus fusiformis]